MLELRQLEQNKKPRKINRTEQKILIQNVPKSKIKTTYLTPSLTLTLTDKADSNNSSPQRNK